MFCFPQVKEAQQVAGRQVATLAMQQGIPSTGAACAGGAKACSYPNHAAGQLLASGRYSGSATRGGAAPGSLLPSMPSLSPEEQDQDHAYYATALASNLAASRVPVAQVSLGVVIRG